MRALLLLVVVGVLPPAGVVRGEVVAVVPGPAFTAGPHFVSHQHTEVVAPLGHAATLHCGVTRLGDRSVSWVRSRDLHILVHAGAVFTGDARVSAPGGGAGGEPAAPPDGAPPASWHALRIERLKPSDAGLYECQLNTEPKMSLFFNLSVVDEAVPTVELSSVPGGEVRGEAGGEAQLWCEARYLPAPRLLPLAPLEVTWRREGATPGVFEARGDVARDTERWAARVVSRLHLRALRPDDAGLYVCSAGGRALSLRLSINARELGAEAMQRDESAASGAPRDPWGPAVALWGLCTLGVLALR